MALFFGQGRTTTFQDRKDAGLRLADKLEPLRAENPIVYALPRGGVPVAFEVAKALQAPLDLLMVRKIGAPGHEEYGIGALVDAGPLGGGPEVLINEPAAISVGATKAYIEATKQRQMREIERQRGVYLRDHPPSPPVAGRCAIVVDDGVATGWTARVAIKALLAQNAGRIVLAVPVAAQDTIEEMKEEGQAEIVCLSAPINFSAVGLHYVRFDQTTDEEVIRCMRESRQWLSGGTCHNTLN